MKDYIYEVARIRVMESKLLTRADYEQLLAEPDVPSAMAFLGDKGWNKDASSPEEMLRGEETAVWGLMHELLKDSDELDILRLTRDYHNLKAAVKKLYTDSPLPPERLYLSGGTIPAETIREAVREQDFDRLPASMAEAAKEATEVLAKTGDGQLCDSLIDKAALAALTRAGQENAEPLLKEYATLTAVSADIRIALRAAASGKDRETILDMLVPVEGLDLPVLAEAALEGSSAVADYLKNTPWEDLSASLSAGMSAFECACDNLLIRRIRPQLTESLTLGPVAAYVIARESEIKCVRMLLTGKANHLPEALLRENLRESYV